MPDLTFDPTDDQFVRKVGDFEIEYEDVFHMNNLYELVYEWLQENDFVSLDGKDDKYETLYKQKEDGDIRFHHIWWRAQKFPNDSDYYKYVMLFDYQTIALGDTKVDYKGQQMKTNKGDIIMRCRTYVVLDYKQKWRNHWFLSLVQNWFWTYLFRDQYENIEEDLWTTTYDLQMSIKQFLGMKNPVEQTESWHPKLGV